MDSRRALAILADGARFDAPCTGRQVPPAGGDAPVGALTRPRAGGRPALPVLAGEVEANAIYESVSADGRRVPLLRLLLSNHCVHDCAYCPLRRSAAVERARLAPAEVARLTVDWHRRGLVEGLFLSSAVDRSADDTMERLVGVARSLRRDHHFLGYVHLKVIPEASPELIDAAGRWADRVSVNVELPTQRRLETLAPGRRLVTIHRAMDRLRDGIADGHEALRRAAERARLGQGAWSGVATRRLPPRFAPAGQVTQLIVGADASTDHELLREATTLYERQRLRRVYYGAYVPLVDGSAALPDVGPGPLRTRRLYEADHLIRHYGFSVDELAPADAPALDPQVDPKLAWALRHPERFPVDVNRAPREALLRVPGFGRRTVDRILAVRAWHRVRTEDLLRLRVPVGRALPFIVAADHGAAGQERALLRLRAPEARRRHVGEQLELFPRAANAASREAQPDAHSGGRAGARPALHDAA